MRTIDARKQHPEIAVVPTASGMIAGAVVGAIAGPPGIAVGSTLGGFIGALAGEALEAAMDEAELRDEELDETIGVAKGDIGAREIARTSFERMRAAESKRAELLVDHALYAADLATFQNASRSGDLIEAFRVFEEKLRAHMAYEELELLPELAREHPLEAEELGCEHAYLRQLLDDIATKIELRTVTRDDLRSLFDALEAHRAHEERLFYVWVDR